MIISDYQSFMMGSDKLIGYSFLIIKNFTESENLS